MKTGWIVLVIAGLSCASVAAAAEFSDITSDSPHAKAIQYLAGKGIVGGYGDNSFRPDHTVDRASFLKLLITLQYSKANINACMRGVHTHFKDVSASAWFAPYVCTAVKNDIATGYNDHTFRPGNTIDIGEASSMLAHAFGLTLPTKGSPKNAWYVAPIDVVAAEHAIPPDVEAVGQSLTRGEAAELLWRLTQKVADQEYVTAPTLLAAQCNWFTKDQIPKVDIQEVRRVWFSWINDARAAAGLAPYAADKELDYSATTWSLHAASIGTISHKRTPDAAYYDYHAIEHWFDTLHLDFSNVDRKTFTENIGWGVYACKKNDCTQDLINAIRTTFDFYMSEKGTASDAHYRSIMDAEFTKIGMGIAVDQTSGKYYITTHYATSITSKPDPICP